MSTWVLEYSDGELIPDDQEALPNADFRSLAKLAGVLLKANEWRLGTNETLERPSAIVEADDE